MIPRSSAISIVQESFAGTVGLHPPSINHKLWDGALAGVTNHLVGGAWRGLDVDLGVGDVVLRQKALGGAAFRAP
jgi:hypothetical protein